MAYGTRARNLLPLIVLVAVLLRGPAAAAGTPEGLRLVDRLLDHLAQCRDYQCRVTAYERQGDQEEERTFRLFVKEERLVRIQVLAGRGKGSEAVLDAQGRVRGRKRGLLTAFARTLQPDDRRIRSLRPTILGACLPSFPEGAAGAGGAARDRLRGRVGGGAAGAHTAGPPAGSGDPGDLLGRSRADARAAG
jgi:hypothetical protein